MDQDPRGGHPAVTRAAVEELFKNAPPGAQLLGLNKEAFYDKLNHVQHYADRIISGDTLHQSSQDPDAQRHHSMADPNKSGDSNVADCRNFIAGALSVAQVQFHAGNLGDAWVSLGAAVHALEDSYSNAHVFRDPAHPTDPHAGIEAMLNFEWWGKHDTHEELFDKVPVESAGHLARPTDQAAATAVAELLHTFFSHLSDTSPSASEAYDRMVSSFIHGEGVHVFADRNAPDYLAAREAHLQNERSAPWESSGDKHSQPSNHDSPSHTHNDSKGVPSSNEHPSAEGPTHGNVCVPDHALAIEEHAGRDPNMTANDGSQIHVNPDASLSEGKSVHHSDAQGNMSLPDGSASHTGDAVQGHGNGGAPAAAHHNGPHDAAHSGESSAHNANTNTQSDLGPHSTLDVQAHHLHVPELEPGLHGGGHSHSELADPNNYHSHVPGLLPDGLDPHGHHLHVPELEPGILPVGSDHSHTGDLQNIHFHVPELEPGITHGTVGHQDMAGAHHGVGSTLDVAPATDHSHDAATHTNAADVHGHGGGQ